jgi:hypothetical protein
VFVKEQEGEKVIREEEFEIRREEYTTLEVTVYTSMLRMTSPSLRIKDQHNRGVSRQ